MKVYKKIINGLNVYYIPTKKIKTIISGIVFETKLTKKYLPEKTLLSSLLTKTCDDMPSEQEYASYLRNMYDTKIRSNNAKRGLTLRTTFYVDVVNCKYLDDEQDLFARAIDMLYKTITKPLFEGGRFVETLIDKEKRLLKEELQSQYNNKMVLVVTELIKTMFKDEEYAIYAGLEEKDVDNITMESLLAAYNDLLHSNAYAFVIGDVDDNEVEKAFAKHSLLKTMVTKQLYIDETPLPKQINESERIINKDANQSIIAVGYRSDIRMNHELYPAMRVFNGMFGGYFHSSLFQEVREKNSLAYYIYSEYIGQKGFLCVTSGINAGDFVKVKEILASTLADYQKGNITEENLNMTKEALINTIIEAEDVVGGMISAIYKQVEFPELVVDINDKIKQIKNVTIDDIVKCSKSIVLDTTVFLEGTGEGGADDESSEE